MSSPSAAPELAYDELLVDFGHALRAVGLPVGSAVVLIMAIAPFIDPATTVLNVHASCVASSVVAPSGGDAAAGPTAADSGRPAVAAGAS